MSNNYPGKGNKSFKLIFNKEFNPNPTLSIIPLTVKDKTEQFAQLASPMGVGIVEQIENSEPIPYESITAQEIENFLDSLYTKTRKSLPRGMTLMTGQHGMFIFNWTLLYGESIKVKSFRTEFGRIQGMYFSLFTKHGLYKLLVHGRSMKVYRGTVLIKEFEDVSRKYYLDHNAFSEQNAPEIKEKMAEVNNYLKRLENGTE